MDRAVGNLYKTQEIDSDVGRYAPPIIRVRYYICTYMSPKIPKAADFIGERPDGEEGLLWQSMTGVSYGELSQKQQENFIRSVFSI
jgi:hypothetical protein